MALGGVSTERGSVYPRNLITPWRGQPPTRIIHGATEKGLSYGHWDDSSPSESGCSTMYSGQKSTPLSLSFLSCMKRLAGDVQIPWRTKEKVVEGREWYAQTHLSPILEAVSTGTGLSGTPFLTDTQTRIVVRSLLLIIIGGTNTHTTDR